MISVSVSVMVASLFAASPVDVRSSTNCPSTEDVVERLRPLIPRLAAPGSTKDLATIDVAKVHSDGATDLHIRLIRADASVIGDRRLLLRDSCQELAEAIATVIAAWETEPLPATDPNVKVEKVTASPRVEAFRQAPLQIFVGAGAGAALVGGVAATGNVEVRVGRSTSHWQLRFAVATETARHLDLGRGHVDWQHTTAAAGVAWRTLLPSWLLSLDAGPVAGWATLQGFGFSSNRQQRSFEFGVASGLRAGRNFGRWSVWTEWRANLWVLGQRVLLTGTSARADLPLVDMTAILGASVILFE